MSHLHGEAASQTQVSEVLLTLTTTEVLLMLSTTAERGVTYFNNNSLRQGGQAPGQEQESGLHLVEF